MLSDTSAGKSQFMLKDIKRSPEENRIKSRKSSYACLVILQKNRIRHNNFVQLGNYLNDAMLLKLCKSTISCFKPSDVSHEHNSKHHDVSKCIT